MNVLIVVPWDQSRGGVTSVVGNLARYLEERSHGVFFLHPQRHAFFLTEGTTRLGFAGFKLRLPRPFASTSPIASTLTFPILFPLAVFQIARLIRRRKIDIVNIHYPSGAYAAFALARKLARVKLVTSIHGADIFPKGRPRRQYGACLKFVLGASDLIVANSRAFRKDFLSLFPDLDEKTVVVHNGIDLDELMRPVAEGYRKNGRRYLLSVAIHNEKKGLDVLLRAFAEIAGGHPDVELLLVGDGPLRDKLEQLAGSLALGPRVKFLGSQDRSAVARLLHGCEIFVHPAVSEPFGIAVVEALACRKPVVATNTGGIPEIVEDGVNGILVEPAKPEPLAQAVSALLADHDLQAKLAENGYRTVERQFRRQNTGRNYEALFSRLTQLGGR